MKLNLNLAGAAGGATTRIWSVPARVNEPKNRLTLPAPSVRVPATRENRERLRALRAAELEAWQSVRPNAALRNEVQTALAGAEAESRWFAGVAAVAGSAIIIGMAASLDFVAHWQRFVNLVQTLLG